ncbi:MAG TPA: adenylyltransferase/cytidyltransferase family protein [Alphaproteobacteria bacterium]|nr:adenylyltransferase/cytidyltransferase family protein [Alphaproteobacteria bacterium]
MNHIDITPDITRAIDAPLAEHGLVFGKFMPPTNGHLYLLDFARRSCRRLTIVVLTLAGEPIPGHLRYEWIRELYPDCTVVHHDHDMPQEPQNPHDIPFYHAWRDTLRKHCPQDDFDALFASESYGYQVAWALGVRFIPVDTARGAVQISGTAMRSDPWRYWAHLHPVIRPYFLKRVAITGGDAQTREGLAAALAAAYDTCHIADYAATFCADLARNIAGWSAADLTAQDIHTIARGQKASMDALARQANRVIFSATTLREIQNMSQARFGRAPDWLAAAAAAEKYDIVLSLDENGGTNGSLRLKAPTIDAARKALHGHLPPLPDAV